MHPSKMVRVRAESKGLMGIRYLRKDFIRRLFLAFLSGPFLL